VLPDIERLVDLKRAEERLDKMALRSELLELKARVEDLKAQVQALEDRLNA
jgi:polyhydroxyalkanoate synthesis regulator phasin